MLRFLRSLVNWTAKNHGVVERPMGFKVNTPNTPSIPTTSAPPLKPSEAQSVGRSLLVETNRKQRQAMIRQLALHEGLRLKPYKCTAGALTIGYGRNLDARGITEAEAEMMLANDIDDFQDRLLREIPWMVDLSPVRQRVLLDMAFNLGISGLLKFQRTLAAVRGQEYERAAAMMLDSRWATQVGTRAKRLSRMIATGQIPPELQ